MTFQNLLRADSLMALAVAATALAVPAQAWTAKPVFHFADDYGFGLPDGLLLSKGKLYGVVAVGGTLQCGSAFQLGKNGDHWDRIVLHQFAGGADDGCSPNAALTLGADGALYGTSYGGGLENCVGIDSPTCGTIYKLTPGHGVWKITILYKFKGGGDGYYPSAALRFGSGGTLFGTTAGYCGQGGATVFTLSPPKKKNGKWTHAVLYNAATPIAGPVTFDSDGNIYGTEGGGCNAGRVFTLDKKTWTFHSLHDFTGADGSDPGAGVIIGPSSMLYGTTNGGGDAGLGTVYSLTPPKHGGQWKLKTLHSFTGTPDGSGPSAELLLAEDGTIYGTTVSGGENNYGSVFQLTAKGKESVIWSFELSGPEGYYPSAPLTLGTNKTLYGTTYYSDAFELKK